MKIPVSHVKHGVQLCCCFVKQENMENLLRQPHRKYTHPSAAHVCLYWQGCQFLFIRLYNFVC